MNRIPAERTLPDVIVPKKYRMRMGYGEGARLVIVFVVCKPEELVFFDRATCSEPALATGEKWIRIPYIAL